MNTTTDGPLDTEALVDPARAERLGKALAERLGASAPTLVVCWDASEDAVLAHVVARELGVGVCLALDTEGIVSLLQPVPAGARVVLVAETFRPRTGLAGLAGVVHHAGGEVAAVAVVDGDVPLDGTTAAGARLVRPEAA